ncbi:hypothetical protein PHRODO_255 [Bacillus phage Phrodo]|uniref:hypothetical protein n=1 Tax=Bacillus phage Phrodo TaxID=1805953 RepID=UPI0007A77526|nr:hypothetical protein BI003_gp255 [Bacillus phage Phrodo]AMW62295.1 hypothetical protein PHRODO_255 [Bacillus phage Phrodo]UGO49066.1 hypothetical protein JARJAR_252 [Bacillus phage vB_BanH_JarJar]UGO50556.1 hypothetical protein RONSWANSON_250 [Bacillus phage vB_BanH_RonSwanson]
MFIVFAYQDYYPAGGLNDIALITEDFNKVTDYIKRHYHPYLRHVYGGWNNIPDEAYENTDGVGFSDNIHILDTKDNNVSEVSVNESNGEIVLTSKGIVRERPIYNF